MTGTLKNILIGGLFLALAAGGYYMITSRSAMTLTFDGTASVSAELLTKTQSFIERRGKLQSLDLNTEIFTDTQFTSLRSYSAEVPEQSLGRINIFDTPVPVPTTRVVPTE